MAGSRSESAQHQHQHCLPIHPTLVARKGEKCEEKWGLVVNQCEGVELNDSLLSKVWCKYRV